jgi:hypothetical protein
MFVEMKSRGHEIKTLVADTSYGGDANVQLAADNGNELISPVPGKKRSGYESRVLDGAQDTAVADGSGKLSFKRFYI